MSDLRGRVLALLPSQVIDVLSVAKAKLRNVVAARKYAPVVEEIFPGAHGHELIVANDDAAVFRVEPTPGSFTILKLASTPTADDLLAAECAALDELGALSELGEWRKLIASVERRGTHERGTWFTQTAIPGVPTSALSEPADQLVAAVVPMLEPVHRATAQTVSAAEPVLSELISEPLGVVKHWRPDQSDAVDRIETSLRGALAGRQLTLSRMHGDYAPTNVLWDPQTRSVSGIVDWKFGTDLHPPEVDLVHYALSLIMARRRDEYGTTVIRLLGDEGDANLTADAALIDQAAQAGPNGFEPRLAVSLAWLQHVAFGLHKAHDLRTNPIWLHKNIDTVIEVLAA